MVPKRTPITSSGAQLKKQQSVQISFVWLITGGMFISNLVHKYSCNEFSIHALKI
jgi:hypothetical protein